MTECAGLEPGKGLVLSCMISYLNSVKNVKCREVLDRLELLVFTDYHFIYKFVVSCQADIKKLRCGRTDPDEQKVSTLRVCR